MRVVFAGTPPFAATILERLIASKHDIVSVYTQPDRPAGRGRQVKESAVKQMALQHHLPIEQPDTLKTASALETLEAFDADIMVVVAYGLMLPRAVLDTPKHGCVNVHASRLPRWRGAAPIQRAIETGDMETGVTIMQMDAGLDTGDILLQSTCPIDENTTSADLFEQLAVEGADTLLATLSQIDCATLKPGKQQEHLATYAQKISKAEAQIDWGETAHHIHKKICAFNPWPVAYFIWRDQTIRVWESRMVNATDQALTPGTVVGKSADGVNVMTGQGVLQLRQIQLPGKGVMRATDFINGHPEFLEAILGHQT